MISLEIPEVKEFMAKLFTGNNFDNFFMKELTIKTFTTFQVIGDFHKGFFDDDELEIRGELEVLWREVQPIAFQMIKGKKQPQYIKLVLSLSRTNIEKILDRFSGKYRTEDIGGLYININFKDGKVNIITGTSMNVFTLDKSLEMEWDNMVKAFLKQNEIACNLDN